MEENKGWWKRYNPTLKDFTERKPNLTILGLWWAMQWRIVILAWVLGFAVSILFTFLGIAVFN